MGDNISYGIGHFFGERTVNRFFSGEKAKHRIDWAEGFHRHDIGWRAIERERG